MRVLRPASENEMVAEFLKAEFESARWGPDYVKPNMARCGVTPAMLLDADLTDADQNQRRHCLLATYRGWRGSAHLFQGWPDRLLWNLVAIGPKDVEHLRYADAGEWRRLSQDTWLPTIGARRISEKDPTILDEIPQDVIWKIAGRIQRGEPLPRTIAIGTSFGNPIIFVEGHARITAYLIAGIPDHLEIIYGATRLTLLKRWGFYPRAH